MKTKPLTDAKCRNARFDEAGGNKLFDGGGLYLDLRSSGSKKWRLKYRFNGKETLTFAAKDWAGSDQFSQGETGLKAVGAVVSILGTVIETASETVVKAPAHPLSAFLMKQWAGASEWAEVGAKVGRGLGAIAGIVLAGFDLIKNAPEAYRNKETKLWVLYNVSGALGVYVAAAAFFGWPLFWPALILSILVGIAIAIFKASALKDWVSRCKFSTGEHYDSLEAELKAFSSAAGD
ncbi:Arm DNA-binding domain-containing protein [Burkholderia vietnamiensis]|uniref:Arm DNA-binding domain-containing protein n=1 Tax=Burkholderia vietnamiensis TaxID=60552 RepID=UPI001E6157D7|nr:Arm DNA-binding domain-containing protein [Burkholderia vietnamiensis]MDN8040404.1 Arm DNA-binding domain-containing protein [Burkholderia vietnamiensis]